MHLQLSLLEVLTKEISGLAINFIEGMKAVK